MIDATYNKVHAGGCTAVGGNQAIGRSPWWFRQKAKTDPALKYRQPA
ncbi:MAG: hypothetical protein LBO67_01970 [Spirochaetaceae bacterium]|jgi:hypothetical protein|nr:hypothetical protein [Spirochaetaceae bacterium]